MEVCRWSPALQRPALHSTHPWGPPIQAAAGVAVAIAGLGLCLALGAVARPVSPIIANAVTIPGAVLAVMFFWLGIWALGLIVLAGAATDLAARAPRTTPP